jgi:hypothetical protein
MSEEIAVAEVTAPAPVIETPAPVVETPSQPASMDDTLAKTMAEIVAKRPVQGEDGKFIVKAGATDATPELKVPGSSEAAPPDPAKPVIEAPQSLPADVRAEWASLPPKHQEWLAAREGEIHKRFTSDGERLKSIEAFDEALAPAREFIEQNRIPKPEYIRRLAVADHQLRTNGPAALAEIARMYGINPGAAQQTIGQPVDPQFNALAQELGAIKSKLTAQEQAAEQAKVSDANAKIEAFKKNAPHFDKVEGLMAKLYEPGLELQTLYDMATKAHPEVSKLMEAEREAKAKADALEKQKADAAAAAKLATLSRKPGSVGVIAKTGGSWEDTMAATHRGIRARG